MYRRISQISAILIVLMLTNSLLSSYAKKKESEKEATYSYSEYPLTRNDISLHLDSMKRKGEKTKGNILLVHGVTYSSHEFDLDYKDYSLVRYLVRQGYCVWRLDIAGYGRSKEVKDGFMIDSDYAAKDVNAAIEKIIELTGEEKIDVLGWSWGTVTSSRSVIRNSEHVRKLILYAPIISGIGYSEVTEAFHHNTWEHAADDFQKDENGDLAYDVTDPLLIELWCSSCWHYDRDTSPNGGRRDICVDKDEILIDLDSIDVPTLVICGDKDPYLNYDLVNGCLDHLPEGSELEVLKGASHIALVEKPYYRDFRKRLIDFLEK